MAVTVPFLAVAPEIETSPEDTTALAGTTAILKCSARGDPPPTLSWWRNGELVNVSGDPRVQVHENGSLTIENVMMEDVGVYQCVAENSQGQEESDGAMLTVDGEGLPPQRLQGVVL